MFMYNNIKKRNILILNRGFLAYKNLSKPYDRTQAKLSWLLSSAIKLRKCSQAA